MPDQTRNLNSVTDFAGTLDSNDRIIMTDNKASLKALTIAILGKAMIEGYTGSSLAGSSQSVKSAIDALYGNMLSLPSTANLRLRYRTDIDCNSVTDEWILGNGTNFPSGARFWYIHSFAYTVNSNGTINTGKQIAYGYSVDKVTYERTCDSGVWNEWTQLPTRNEVDALNSKLTLYNTANSVGFELPSSKSYIKIKLLNSGGTGAEVTIDKNGNVTFDAIE